MKLEVGMWVKFKDKKGCTYIRKVIDGYKEHWYGCRVDKNANNVPFVSDKNIINYSFNIIDLIEVGDYVNGEKVIALEKDVDKRNIYPSNVGVKIFTDYELQGNWYFGIQEEDIKSIVTKEMFEQMKYEVE